MKLALRCLNGAIKHNTEALNKMRERQEKTTELPSSLADDLKKRKDEQRVFSKTCLAQTKIREINIQRTVIPLP